MKPTKRPSDGAIRLSALAEERGAQSRLAAELGVGQSVVSRWLSGARTPDARMRLRIARVLEIPCEAWDSQGSP
jgi:transcriptional regulator with XRE-family HTH domain